MILRMVSGILLNMNEKSRFIEEGDTIIFIKINQRMHKSFAATYTGLTIPQARRKMKKLWATRSVQNEMIHYLKEKNLLKKY